MSKILPLQLIKLIRGGASRRNLKILVRFLLILLAIISCYSVLFHVLMEREGQQHTWLTGFYWTLTVMSTLGFGDITFHTDLGRMFSMLVLISGMLFLLVLLPFTFIEFFYEPWMRAQAERRAPRELPEGTRDHLILTNYDEVTVALIRRLEQFAYDYVLMVPDLDEALRLHDIRIRVAVGELDDPDAYKQMRVERAALVVATANDTLNTNVSFTVRGVCEKVPIISTASDEASVDILELAGSNHVLRLEEMLGQSFSRRTMGTDAVAHVIGQFDELLIAEAPTKRTPLVGKTVRESRLRENIGVAILGVWSQGVFQPGAADTMIEDNAVLVLAGSREHFDRYNEIYLIYNVSTSPILIIGAGGVGRATARALADRGIDYRIVERVADRVWDHEKSVIGNAAELEILKQAGIDETPTVIITTHDDDMNVYLTVYCRRLRPDVQILSRAQLERNVRTLYRAGADIVMSYASMGATSIVNLLRRGKTLMLAEGLDLLRVAVPPALVGKTLTESSLREETGCAVVAIRTGAGMEIIPDPQRPLPEGGELLLIASTKAAEAFFDKYQARPTDAEPQLGEIAASHG